MAGSVTHVRADRRTRMRLRAEYAVVVWVRCGACHRILGRLYGSQSEPVAFDNGQVSGLLVAGARIDHFRRHPSCPADSPADWTKLSVAYRTAAARPGQNHRVIVLPFDLQLA